VLRLLVAEGISGGTMARRLLNAAAVHAFPFVALPSSATPGFHTLCIEEECALLDPAAADKLFDGGETTALCPERMELAGKVASEFGKTGDARAGRCRCDVMSMFR
jgi:hypothetical protein